MTKISEIGLIANPDAMLPHAKRWGTAHYVLSNNPPEETVKSWPQVVTLDATRPRTDGTFHRIWLANEDMGSMDLFYQEQVEELIEVLTKSKGHLPRWKQDNVVQETTKETREAE